MHRLFVALTPPRAMRDALLALAHGGPEAMRWEPDERLHVTLRFIGEVDRRGMEAAIDALSTIVAAPARIGIGGVGRFDHGRSGALWARVAPGEDCARLHAKAERALTLAGFAPEKRAYVPHVTLGRWSRGPIDPAPWLLRHAGFAHPPVEVAHFSLVESVLRPEGPLYDEVARFALGRI